MKCLLYNTCQTLINWNSFLKVEMPSSGVLRRVALVKTDFSEEYIASIIRVTKVGTLGTLAGTSN
jgi:hypothetical protein